MSVTLSLKVCQRTDHADKPELSESVTPANKGVDGQLEPQRSLPNMLNSPLSRLRPQELLPDAVYGRFTWQNKCSYLPRVL